MEPAVFIAVSHFRKIHPLRYSRIQVVLVALTILIVIPSTRVRSQESNLKRSNAATRIGVVLDQQPMDAAIVKSLGRMGLYESAIARCQAGIASTATGSIGHARWSSWLIATLAERDAENADSISKALTEAKSIRDAFLSDEKNQTFSLWVDYSYEVVRFDLSNRSVANYLAAPTSTIQRDDALLTLRATLDHLGELKELVQKKMGEALRRTDRDAASIARDLSSLRNRIALLEIDSLLLRGECYPPKSDECIAAGTEALSAIEKIASQIESDWNGRSSLELARYQSLIALNRFADTVRGLEQWIPTVSDPSIRNRAIAMSAHAIQLQGDLERAQNYLASVLSNTTDDSPEIAIVKLELQIATWKHQSISTNGKALSKDESDRTVVSILNSKDDIANRFGNYWQLRAEALIVASSQPGLESNRSVPSSSSLDLLKLEIRQRLAAGDFAGAIERLQQAESAAFSANDHIQAFAFAKTALGLMQQPANSDTAQSPNVQLVVDQMALVARKYSDQDSAVLLHQTAIEQQMSMLASETRQEIAGSMGEKYRRLMRDHVRIWPHDTTSDDDRNRLQRLYLATADVELLIDLWREELTILNEFHNVSPTKAIENFETRIEAAKLNVVNALLFSNVLRESKINAISISPLKTDDLPPSQIWVVNLLSGDFDWWTVDGGLRCDNGQSMNWSLPTSTSDGELFPTTIQKILLAAEQSDVASVESEMQSVIDWSSEETLEQIGWLTALNSTLSNILRVRDPSVSKPDLFRDWAFKLSQLHAKLRAAIETNTNSLHPTVQKSLMELDAVVEARIAVMLGDAKMGIGILERLRNAEPRNPRWSMEIARIFEVEGGDSNEKSLQGYRQLAAGSSIGSEVWFEARLSSARCLRRAGKQLEADEIVALVPAMIVNVPEKWKRRIE